MEQEKKNSVDKHFNVFGGDDFFSNSEAISIPEQQEPEENLEDSTTVESLDLGSADTFGFPEAEFSEEDMAFINSQEEEKKVSDTQTRDQTTASKTDKKKTETGNPIEDQLNSIHEVQTEAQKETLFARPPVFKYAAVEEEITDKEMTFEDLRIQKSSDFPELEDGKKVSWSVEYGITKVIVNPKEAVIAKIKSEIEMSKEFINALKKSKDKEPKCLVKPKIAAQTKGKVASYKGVYGTLEEAHESGKPITIIPSRDGKVYEMRKSEIGTFLAPKQGSEMLSDVKAGFIPALPLIPQEILLGVISFFRSVAIKGNYEALVNVYWDKEREAFVVDVPKQVVTSVSINSTKTDEFDNEKYVHFMDIHSHNSMGAYFSKTDDEDEKSSRFYTVIGKIYDYMPAIKCRFSSGGTFVEINPSELFEDVCNFADYPMKWLDNIEYKKQSNLLEKRELILGICNKPGYKEDFNDEIL